MFEMIPEEILNSFALECKIQSLERKLTNKRTPKKYIEPIKTEIARISKLRDKRRAIERRGRY